MFTNTLKSLVLGTALLGLVGGSAVAQSRFSMKLSPTKEVRKNVHVLYAGAEVCVKITSPAAGQAFLILAPAMAIGQPDMNNLIVLEALRFDGPSTWEKSYTVPKLLVGTAFNMQAIFVPERGSEQRSPMLTLLIAADAADAKVRGLRKWGFGADIDVLDDVWTGE